jgi:predicted alpha/beta superfamily hydrolase
MEFKMFKGYLIAIVLFMPFAASSEQNFQYSSKSLQTEIEISVSLPKAYDSSKRKYPVVFVFDGPGYFNLISEFAHKMYLVHKIPELIIVGIPTVDSFHNFVGDSHDEYSVFIVEEIAELIEKKYRSNGNYIGIGHSLGASFVLKQSITKPDFFSFAAISSPVISERVGLTMKDATSAVESVCGNDGTVFISKGNEQGVYEQTIPILASNKKLTCLSFKTFGDETHASLPLISPYFALSAFFERFLPPTLSNPSVINTIEDIANLGGYDALKLYYQDPAVGVNEIPNILISRLAFTYINAREHAKLLDLFKKEALNRSQLLYYVANRLKPLGELDLAISLLKIDKSTNAAFEPNVALLEELISLKDLN